MTQDLLVLRKERNDTQRFSPVLLLVVFSDPKPLRFRKPPAQKRLVMRVHEDSGPTGLSGRDGLVFRRVEGESRDGKRQVVEGVGVKMGKHKPRTAPSAHGIQQNKSAVPFDGFSG